MPGPQAAQILQMSHPVTEESGKCPVVARGGKGTGRSSVELTGALFYLFYLLFSHNKDYTSITLYKDVARGPQKTTRLVRGGPLVTIILSNRNYACMLLSMLMQSMLKSPMI